MAVGRLVPLHQTRQADHTVDFTGGLERAHDGGTVSVRAYSRVRNGKTEQVGAYQRSDPPGGGSSTLSLRWLRDRQAHRTTREESAP